MNMEKDEIREAIEDLQDEVTRGMFAMGMELSSLLDELLHEVLQMRQDLETARLARDDDEDDE